MILKLYMCIGYLFQNLVYSRHVHLGIKIKYSEGFGETADKNTRLRVLHVLRDWYDSFKIIYCNSNWCLQKEQKHNNSDFFWNIIYKHLIYYIII